MFKKLFFKLLTVLAILLCIAPVCGIVGIVICAMYDIAVKKGCDSLEFIAISVCIVCGILFVGGQCLRDLWRVRRTHKEVVERPPRDLKQFLAESDFGELTNDEIEFVQKIRKVITNLADVPTDNLYSNDTFKETMAHLPFWDSMDFVELMIAMEEMTGINYEETIKDWELTTFPDYRNPNYTVADFVKVFLAMYRAHVVKSTEK